MNRILSLLFLLLLSSCGKPSLPEGVTEEQVEDELFMVNDIWDREGKVITGRIDPLPEVAIAARTPLGADGRFCAAVADGRVLTFYAHGFEPLWVEDYRWVGRSVYDAGTIVLEKTPEENLRTWNCVVNGPDPGGTITGTLIIQNKDYLFQDHGYQGGARPRARAERKTVKAGEMLSFDGLSNIPYLVELSGPGLKHHTVTIDPWAKGIIEEEPVTLEGAPELRFTYRARTRRSGEPWKEDGAIKTASVVCNGKAEFRFTEERDGLGNSLELRLRPEEKGVVVSFFMFRDDRFMDLGEGELTPDLHWDNVGRPPGGSEMVLEPGHLYLFQIEDVNDTDIELLFRVD